MKKLIVTSIILVIACSAKAQVTITTTNAPSNTTTTTTTTAAHTAAVALYPTFVGYNTVRTITKAKLLLVKTIDVTDIKYKVSSFTMSVTHDGMNKEVTSNSNELTPQMLNLINGVIVGDKVTFENIKVKVNDDTRSLSPLFVTIVE